MFSNTEFFENIYDAFNRREIETVLSVMADDVKWANGMEGGFVFGRDNVREYWRKQFEIIKPQLETLEFETVNDRCVVKLRQTVRDLSDNILDEKIVEHIFTFENGLIKTFEIGNFTKPFFENENFQKLPNRS
jgi:glutamate synthase domain-containing protein 3